MLALVAAAMMAAAPAPDAVVGTWKSQTKNAVVEIKSCGGQSLCGRLMSSDDISKDPQRKDAKNSDAKLRDRPLKGIQMLGGFRWDGSAWADGWVYNGADGRTYKGKITILDDNRIELRGCVFVPLCKTETWTRVS